MIRFFIEGGIFWMSLATLQLIALLLAAWKAPGWVKEIGLLALITGFIAFLFGFGQMANVMKELGMDISMVLIFVGLEVACRALIYGAFIYAVSLVIRIIQKPKFL